MSMNIFAQGIIKRTKFSMDHKESSKISKINRRSKMTSKKGFQESGLHYHNYVYEIQNLLCHPLPDIWYFSL